MKVETEARKLKRKAREAKEIARLEKEKAKPKSNMYFPYLVVLLCMIYIIDEVTSAMGTNMQSEICGALFGGDLAKMSVYGMLGTAAIVFALMYKTLADKYGRKFFLFLNTLGLGLGMFVVYVSGSISSIAVYVMGSALISFFVPHDMQVVYIMETAPVDKRATLYSVIKGIATVGVVLIPTMRSLFMGSDTSKWHMVYLVPAAIAMVVGLIAMFTARESDVFIENRLAYLRKSDEERAADEAKKRDEQASQGGLLAAVKFAMNHKQLRNIIICSVLFTFILINNGNYQKILTNTYTKVYGETGVEMVTMALFMYPFTSALFQFINGFLSDKFGRKADACIMATAAFIFLILFYVGTYALWNPYIVGLLIGAFVGCSLAANDTLGSIMVGESAPTNLRSSILAAQTVFLGIGALLSGVISLVLISIFPSNAALPLICLGISVPGVLLSLILLYTKVGETKGISLDTVRGDEWD